MASGRMRQALAVLFVGLPASSGCAAPVDVAPLVAERAAASSSFTPSRTEANYVSQTARTIYRTGPIERSRTFLPGDGFRLCIRAPRGGDYDHTLLTLQRRITEDFIPQASDDLIIDRSRAGALPCRQLVRDWILLR